jgi:ABC-type Fe3+-hydroxamate transport system substrate-binding protein
MSYRLYDQIGRGLELMHQPQRIISLVPSITEYLYDLGLAEQVVAITKFCVHPEEWHHEKEIIGGTKQQHLGKINSLKPDFVIASKEENIKSYVEKISEICPVYVSDVVDFESALRMMSDIGTVVGKQTNAEKITQTIRTKFNSLNLLNSSSKLAYCIWKDPWMWAGSDTFISRMLKYAGFENIVSSERYPEIKMEEIIEQNPDYIFLSSEPFPFQHKHIEQLKAVFPKAKFKIVDGEMFSWYGSRMLKAPEYFQSLHQELKTK